MRSSCPNGRAMGWRPRFNGSALYFVYLPLDFCRLLMLVFSALSILRCEIFRKAASMSCLRFSSRSWQIKCCIKWWCHAWKRFPRYWPFVWGIHRSPVHSPHKGSATGASVFFFCISLNKRLNKPFSCRRFDTLSRWLWRHCNDENS